MSAIEFQQRLAKLHSGIDNDRYLSVLLEGAEVGGTNFLQLYRDCMERTGTEVAGWKHFRRAQRALQLARCFQFSLNAEGEHAECGVFRGMTALMLARVAKAVRTDYRGESLHLIDSYAGLSAPTPKDAVGVRKLNTGGRRPVYSHAKGHFATGLEEVQANLSEFSALNYHKGWIPDVFAALPERQWAFVHIDVDLYKPTKDCVEYFLPRLAPGGVMINDDFGSPNFPGGGLGWSEAFEAAGLSYAVLDTGQSLYIRDA